MREVGTVAGIGVLAAGVVAAREATGGSVALLVGASVVVGGAALIVAVRGIDDLAVGLLVAAVGVSPWNALAAGSLKLGPGLLALALILLVGLAVVRHVPLRVPGWVWVLGASIAVIAVLTFVWPPSTSYFATRYIGENTSLSATQLDVIGLLNLVAGAQWLVAVVALPVAVCLAVALGPARSRLPLLLADAWVLGSAVSAGVALTDEAGLTRISAALLPVVDIGGRQSGLSVQPNHLAVAIALTLPVAVWRLTNGGRPRLMAAAVLLMLGGLVVSESRGGLVAALVAAAVVLLADPRARRFLPPLTGLAVAGVVVVTVAAPQVVGGAAEKLRLSGGDTATESDALRSTIGAQAFDDFLHSPLRGIGIEVAVQGHNIYLQLLAAGGLLLLLGFVLAVAGFVADARSVRVASGGLSAALALSVLSWLVVGVVENHLTDLFLYVPFALVAGLRAMRVPDAADGPAAEKSLGGTRV